jgi:hypothetical protein
MGETLTLCCPRGSFPCPGSLYSSVRSRCIGDVVGRPRQRNAQCRQASPCDLFVSARHIVVPVHEGALKVGTPRPNVEFEERR